MDSIYDKACHLIRISHIEGRLPELLAKALRERAAMVILIDVTGGVTVTGSNNPYVDTAIRDHSMLVQINELLRKNMDDVIKNASKETSTISKETV